VVQQFHKVLFEAIQGFLQPMSAFFFAPGNLVWQLLSALGFGLFSQLLVLQTSLILREHHIWVSHEDLTHLHGVFRLQGTGLSYPSLEKDQSN
jgi:hypothetical protein